MRCSATLERGNWTHARRGWSLLWKIHQTKVGSICFRDTFICFELLVQLRSGDFSPQIHRPSVAQVRQCFEIIIIWIFFTFGYKHGTCPSLETNNLLVQLAHDSSNIFIFMLRPLHRPAQYLPWTNFCNRFLMVCCQNTTTQSEINFVDFTLMDFVWSSRVWFFKKRGGIGGKLWENPCRCMLQLCYVISTCFFWVKISMFQCMERNPIRGLRVRWKLRSPKSNAFQTMSQWWVVERVFESICRDILGVRSLRVCFFFKQNAL